MAASLPQSPFSGDAHSLSRRTALANWLEEGASLNQVADRAGHTPPNGILDIEEESRPRVLLPIYGQTPTDVMLRASYDEEGFGEWLFGVKPYAYYVDPRSEKPRGTLWELFWFVDEAGNAYRATLGDVELLVARGAVDDDDRLFLRNEDTTGSDAPRARDDFKQWHDERLERFRKLLFDARDAWVRRVARRRLGVLLGSLQHGCLTRIEEISPWPETGGVYFVRAGDRVKIGKATNIANRLRALQTGCPEQLQLMAIADGSFLEEAHFHKRLANRRLRGEWFIIDDFILGLIATVRELPDFVAVAGGAAPRAPHATTK